MLLDFRSHDIVSRIIRVVFKDIDLILSLFEMAILPFLELLKHRDLLLLPLCFNQLNNLVEVVSHQFLSFLDVQRPYDLLFLCFLSLERN
jgi:hypothetical protein